MRSKVSKRLERTAWTRSIREQCQSPRTGTRGGPANDTARARFTHLTGAQWPDEIVIARPTEQRQIRMRCMAGSESGGEHEGTGLYADVKPEIGQQITPGLDGTPLMCAWAAVCVCCQRAQPRPLDRQAARQGNREASVR